MHYQNVLMRIPFVPEAGEDVPSEWDWTTLAGSPEPVIVLDCDPVSTDPNVQWGERLPDLPLHNPLDDIGVEEIA